MMESSPKQEPLMEFENQTPIADVAEALQLLGQHKVLANIETAVMKGGGTPYIQVVKISGWPETLEWTKNYRVDSSVVEVLLENKWIQNATPSSWGLSSLGAQYIREISDPKEK